MALVRLSCQESPDGVLYADVNRLRDLVEELRTEEVLFFHLFWNEPVCQVSELGSW